MNSIAYMIAAVDEFAPAALAESWDNVGLIIGDAAARVTTALITVDLTPDVLREAEAIGAQAVVAYHPPVFHATKRLLAGDLGYEAARRNLAVISPHTALDAASGGTNDVLVSALGLVRARPLQMRGDDSPGIGRVADTDEPLRAQDFLARIKSALSLSHLLFGGTPTREIRTVAVCAGAGGAFVSDAVKRGADLYLTGELSHHDVLRARRLNLDVVCTLHSNTERIGVALLSTRLAARLPRITFHLAASDHDPLTVV
jgi:dinuclear metal center YbgI/SA1388 family protein